MYLRNFEFNLLDYAYVFDKIENRHTTSQRNATGYKPANASQINTLNMFNNSPYLLGSNVQGNIIDCNL